MPGWTDELDVQRPGVQLVVTLAELRAQAPRMSSPHATESAWHRMALNGVVAVGSKPAIYVKEVQQFEPQAEHELHRQLWLNGTAPILAIIDREHMRIYSARPQRAGSKSGAAACVEVLSRVADVLRIRHLVDRVQTGTYFHEHREHFRHRNGVDQHFLRQLLATRKALVAADRRISVSLLHRTLVRTLFLRYLSDRGVLGRAFFETHFRELSSSLVDYLRAKPQRIGQRLTQVYSRLANAVGARELEEMGALFSDPRLREQHFEILVSFLADDNIATRQLALGTWLFDLSLLPIELVSAVYQEFVSLEVEDAKKKIGLVATPRHLAETVLDIAFLQSRAEAPRVLDPACGSGIFLVGAFNRVASNWRATNPTAAAEPTLTRLREMLRRCFVGIELNDTACELARLNLLHALLGHLPSDGLSDLLCSASEAALASVTNIRSGSFFDSQFDDQMGAFDVIAANPPWSKDPDGIADWRSRNPERPVPERSNLIYPYAWRVPDFLKPDGIASLVLDAKAMLVAPPASAFAEKWFGKHRVYEVVNLTAMRTYLFKTHNQSRTSAGRAAAIVTFGAQRPTNSDAVRYLTPTPSDALRHGTIMDLSSARAQRIAYPEILSAARSRTLDQVWRVRLFGTGRDVSVIERLRAFPRVRDSFVKGRTVLRQGFNRHGGYGSAKDRSLLREIPFLPTSGSEDVWALALPAASLTRAYGASKDETTKIRDWPADEAALFRGFRLVLHHTPLLNPPMLRAAVTTADFTFHKEILGLYGLSAEWMRFLAAVLNSEIAYYYFFHTSVAWGVDPQPQLRHEDILELPVPPVDTPEREKIFSEVVRTVELLEAAITEPDYQARFSRARRRISKLLSDYYALTEWEQDLVRDCAEVLAPLAFGSAPTSVALAESDYHAYVQRLTGALSEWSGKGNSLRGTAYVSGHADLGLVLLSRESSDASGAVTILSDDDKLSGALRQVRQLIAARDSAALAVRDVLVFEGRDLYLTKPLMRSLWTKSAALADADMIASAILATRYN